MSRDAMLTPKQIKELFQAHHREPNRALGQNFLVDVAARDRIAAAVPADGNPVLEIGPGLGALTQALCGNSRRVVAVELDRFLAEHLARELCPRCPGLTVAEGDILKTDLAGFFAGPWHAAGNLPYYITTPILERLLLLLPLSLTFLMQREAAPRLLAGPGDKLYGPVPVFCALYYHAQVVADLAPHSFYPPPEVHSRAIHLAKRADHPAADPAAFFAFLETIFAQRRKTLLNNLAAANVPRARVQDFLAQSGIYSGVRAENLPFEQILLLYNAICN